MSRLLALAVLTVVGGCFPASEWECELDDSECSGGEVCARTHECMPASEVRAVRVTWTIQGQTDLATACGGSGIDHLAISFVAGEADTLDYTPVPCPSGVFTMDKLPLRMSVVALRGKTASDAIVYGGDASIGGANDIAIDLLPY